MSDVDVTVPEPEQQDAPQQRDPLVTLSSTLASLRGRPLLCFVGKFSTHEVLTVRDLLSQLSGREDFCGELSVLLESPGGYPDDVYRMILALREYATDLEILVPQWAKSAATLFCLAANTIHIGKYGELGPLDPQRPDLKGSFRRTSALESFTALRQLFAYSLESLDGLVRHLLIESVRRDAPMDFPYAIEHARPLFGAIISPLFSQVNPLELGDAGRALQESEKYAELIMQKWCYADVGDERRRAIARRLTWEYPSHGFVIDMMEALDIGLKAQPMDSQCDLLSNEIIQAVASAGAPEYLNLVFPEQTTQPTQTTDETMETDNDETNETNDADGSDHQILGEEGADNPGK